MASNISKRLFFISLFCFLSITFSDNHRHVVSYGDSLSCIAEKYIGYPVYGDNGSLNLLLSYNDGIENKNLIDPGKFVAIPNNDAIQSFVKKQPLSSGCNPNASRWAQEHEVSQLHDKIDRLERKIDQLTQVLANRPVQAPAEEQAQETSPLPRQEPVQEVQHSNNNASAFLDRRRYYGELGFLFHELKGEATLNNSSATLLSDPSWQLGLGWKTPMRGNPKAYSHILAQISYYRYSDNTTNFNVADEAVFSPNITIGVGRQFLKDSLDLEIYVGVYRQVYFFTPNANTIALEADWTGKMGLQSDLKLMRKTNFKLGLRPYAQIIGLGDFVNDNGFLTGLQVYTGFKQHELNFKYSLGQFESSNAEFDTQQVDISYRHYF